MVEYDTFKEYIFEAVSGSSRTIIIHFLKWLSNDFNKDLKLVIKDYNEYTGYADYERLEDYE